MARILNCRECIIRDWVVGPGWRSIDPSGRGCSEAIAPAKSRDSRSLNADASVFRDFIERFLELGHRCIAGKLNAAGLSLGGAVLKSARNQPSGHVVPGKLRRHQQLPCHVRVACLSAVAAEGCLKLIRLGARWRRIF